MKHIQTMRDIALLAGVSRGTVDRVIHKRGHVSAKVYEKVAKLLDEINYQPNLIARNLKINRGYRICVLIPDPKRDGYWAPLIDGINIVIDKLKSFGVDIEISFFNPKSSKSFSNANIVIQRTIPNAVILVPLFHKEALIALEDYNALGIMVSTFHNRIDFTSIRNFVGQDLYQSGRVAAKLLDSKLNKEGDVAVIHIQEKNESDIQMQEKEEGFRHYFEQSGNFRNNVISSKLKGVNIESALTIFLQKHKNLIGIFVTTSKAYQIADIIKKITERKLVVIGCDLLSENVACLKNETIDFLIHQNLQRQAYLGVNIIAEHLLFETKIPDQILLPIDIINSENVKSYISVKY